MADAFPMAYAIGCNCFSNQNSVCFMEDLKLPEIIVHHVDNVDGPPFLSLRHMKIKLEYPDGTFSEEFVHDIVSRSRVDAVVIVPYELRRGSVYVWLRSCIRPSIGARFAFPNTQSSGWELPAGLIDPGETPVQAAIRELEEEVGFSVNTLANLGRPLWGNVGLSGERLYFFSVDVTGRYRNVPSEDGSPLERHGKCVAVPLEDAINVGDLKTELGILRLQNLLR